jgi:hypothetical protein
MEINLLKEYKKRGFIDSIEKFEKYKLEYLAKEITKNYKYTGLTKLLYKWFIWIFITDDYLENSSNTIETKNELIKNLVDMNKSVHFLVIKYIEICDIIKKEFSKIYPKFILKMHEYLKAVYVSQILSINNKFKNVQEFLNNRILESGAGILLTFIEMESYNLIPEKLVENISIIITLTNDMHSYEKEKKNKENNNLIIYLMEIENKTYQIALKIVQDKLDDEYNKFNKLSDHYPFKELLKDLLTANKNWHILTNRYINN